MEQVRLYQQAIDLSRICFSDHETMVPSQGWSGCFHTFTAFCLLQPRLGTIVLWSLNRVQERSIDYFNIQFDMVFMVQYVL
jgi:hypothetical protein